MVDIRKNSYLAFFFVILAFELGIMVYLIFGKRMVTGHDGFELFAHQWFFINSKFSHQEFPLWSPYLNHGTPVWWYFIYSRMDIFSNILMLFAPWVKGVNFLGFFYSSLFFDKFILLCGVWLLAKRYFSSSVTVFFVASTVMATTVAYTQNSFPLVMFYSLPLITYLLHRFFDTFNWMWLFLAAYLFCVVSINVYYFIAVITLSVFVHFLTAICMSKGGILKGFKAQVKDILWICGSILVLSLLGAIYFLGHDPLMYINADQRQPDAGVPLNVFLSYGAGTDLFKWWELLLGVSPQMDYTLYMGVFGVPLIIIGSFFSKNINKYPFLWGALFFLLFSCATPVSVAAYYFWPLMKLYRHIAYVAPLIKLYLCFLAGFGFEWLFDPDREHKDVFRISMLASIFLFLNAMFLFQLVLKPQVGYFMYINMVQGARILRPISSLLNDFYHMALFSLLASLMFSFRPFIKFSKYPSLYVVILLFLHLFVINWYAFKQIELRTFPLSQQQYSMMDFRKVPFVPRRAGEGQINSNSREKFIKVLTGAISNSAGNFTFSDEIETKSRSDFCLLPFYHLFSAFGKHPQSPVLLKLAGASQDKIQFFSQAYFVGSDKAAASALQDKKYAGDMLFYQSTEKVTALPKDDPKRLDLSQDQRLIVPYRVLSFSPNRIVISVDTSGHAGAWMQYSDNWHPSWKARINGQLQKLYIGSMAYKALPLKTGKNIIQLYVESKPVEFLYAFFMISSFIWLVLLIWLLAGFSLNI